MTAKTSAIKEIERGNISGAFEVIQPYFAISNTYLHDRYITLKAQFSHLQNDWNDGTISREDYQNSRSDIAQKLIQLIGELPSGPSIRERLLAGGMYIIIGVLASFLVAFLLWSFSKGQKLSVLDIFFKPVTYFIIAGSAAVGFMTGPGKAVVSKQLSAVAFGTLVAFLLLQFPVKGLKPRVVQIVILAVFIIAGYFVSNYQKRRA